MSPLPLLAAAIIPAALTACGKSDHETTAAENKGAHAVQASPGPVSIEAAQRDFMARRNAASAALMQASNDVARQYVKLKAEYDAVLQTSPLSPLLPAMKIRVEELSAKRDQSLDAIHEHGLKSNQEWDAWAAKKWAGYILSPASPVSDTGAPRPSSRAR